METEEIHDLEELLDYAVDQNEELESFRLLCQEVTEYYIEERYAFQISSNLTVKEIGSKISQVKQFVKKLV